MPLEPSHIRAKFPALASGAVFFDNPGGSQVAKHVIDRMTDHLINKNANLGGAFPTSQASDALMDMARQATADFLNANEPQEIVFGPNMTTLTFALSRSLARELKAGDEIVVTRLDHDANIAPWLAVAQERECKVRWVDFDVEDCTLRMDQLEGAITKSTRLVAVGYASNAVGTINPVRRIAELAHQVGALCYVDAVQFAPHGPIDVRDIGCDFLVFSAYKVFGPHVGALFGKLEHLERLQPYKVRPAPDHPPGKFETGTQSLEGVAGLLGALEYLEELGSAFGAEHAERYSGDFQGRGLELKKAMSCIRAHEMELTRSLIETLQTIGGLKIYGITDPLALDRRVPTVAFRLEGHHPRQVAESLAEAGIYVWDGNYYALAVTERLGLEESGGMVRVGLVHYNTREEIDRLGEALRQMVS
jgi:cysteine desulfurase family protein (TIGR01976 family)